jgi:hypothetical protein
MNNVTNQINDIQKKEKIILHKILNNVLSKSIKSNEKELIKNIITSFFELNKRFEYIKANRKTLLVKNPKISNILTEYNKSIVELEKKVNSL